MCLRIMLKSNKSWRGSQTRWGLLGPPGARRLRFNQLPRRLVQSQLHSSRLERTGAQRKLQTLDQQGHHWDQGTFRQGQIPGRLKNPSFSRTWTNTRTEGTSHFWVYSLHKTTSLQGAHLGGDGPWWGGGAPTTSLPTWVFTSTPARVIS